MAKRGFAALTPERRKAISSLGGKAVKPQNRSFSRNKDLAISAGKKGGISVSPENRSFSRNRALAAESGRKGGIISRKPVT